MTEKIHVPSGVAALRDALIREGFRACPVGGCVRDSLLGRTPEDWDICTSARPERILALFPGSVSTGGAYGTVTVSKGDTSYTFQSPLPAVQYPYVQEDRVFFYDYSSSAAAVTTLEGKTVLTAPLGQLNTLFGEDVRYLAAYPQDGADWTLYSWDGEALVTLPGGTGSWCSLQGPLVEVLGQEGAAYYRPDSGACVFRAWFDLEERPGLAQSEEQPEQLP